MQRHRHNHYYHHQVTCTVPITRHKLQQFRIVELIAIITVGFLAQLAERRSSSGELTLSCARPAADG